MDRIAMGIVGLNLLGCSLEPETFDAFGPAATGGTTAADVGSDDAEDAAETADDSGSAAPDASGSSGGSEPDPAPDPAPDPDPDPDSEPDDGTTGGEPAEPGCGDGIVDVDEECDDGNAQAGDGCSHHCLLELAAPKRVFITSGMLTGAMGGLAGADAVCQSLADGAGLTGTYLAWLSDGIVAPAFRFTHATEPYVLVDGTPIAEDWADLVDGTLMHAIDLTEGGTPPAQGTHVCGQTAVWSNVTADGGHADAASHCVGWTDANGIQSHSGRWDLTGADWSASCFAGGATCLWAAPIYCFEQ